MRTLSVRCNTALFLVACAALSACASGGVSTESPNAVAPTSHNRSVITTEEIPLTGSESAYDLIQRIRPEYLRVKPAQGSRGSRGSDAPAAALVVGGQRAGEVTDLRSISASGLASIRYYSIEEAKLRFGMQYAGGVLELTYRTAPRP